MNVARTVREYEKAGVAALHLEDQAFPKKCGHLSDKELISAGEFTDKLDAALQARTGDDLMIIARTDARGPLGIAEAIDRAGRYAAAGADVIFVEAPQSIEEIEKIAASIHGVPLLINMVQGGLTPDTAPDELAALGYRIAIHPGALLAPYVLHGLEALGRLGGTIPEVTPGPQGLFELVGLREWSAIGERYRDDTKDGA
jgi:2-methylisocitrate lyase-like PEP mutase family enzyme